MPDFPPSNPKVVDRATSERSNWDRGVVSGGVQEARTGIREVTLPARARYGGPATAQELYRPPDAAREFPPVDSQRYALLPPFFETTWEARQARVKAARDAADQWAADAGDWAVIGEFTLGLVTPPSKFDPAYETVPDYVDQFHVSLEHIYRNPLWIRMGAAGSVRGLTRMLAVLFPKLFTAGRQVAGMYRIGKAGGTLGHHVLAKGAFPKSVWNRMFAISQQAIKDLGWNHDNMTRMQRYLYRELFKRGTGHTMKDHMMISYAALRAGGATHEQARWLVAQALRNLRRAGIRKPIHLPTFGRAPK